MSMMNKKTRTAQRGMSVVEIMIAIAISLVVVLGMERIFVASLRANSDAIAFTNLNSQMRATMEAMSRDIRRSGFWAGSMTDIGSGLQGNPFIDVTLVDLDGDVSDGECVLFGYDRDNDGSAADADEWRGFRYDATDDVVEVKVGGGAAGDSDCTEGTWESFIDPNSVLIDDLAFVLIERRVVIEDDCPDNPNEFVIYVRELNLVMDGHLTSDATVTRNYENTIRLRNDRIEEEAIAGGCP